MAESVTSLRLSIDSREVKTAQKELDKLSSSAHGTEKSAKSLSLGFGALSSVIAGVSIGVLAKQFISTADAMTNVNNQLKLVTNSTEELATAQKELFNIAQRTRQDYASTAQTYANMSDAMKEMGKSQQDVLRLTETINKAVAISGGTTQQAAAAVQQLGQAFGKGVLNGDELNSIMENSRGLAKAIADGMGVPIGKLKQLGQEGKITGEVLSKALEKSAKTVDDKFGKMVPTAEQAMTMVWNSIALMVSKTDTEINGSGGFASIMEDMSKSMDKNSDKIAKTVGKLGNEIGTRFRAVGSIIGLVSATVMYSATKLIEDTVNGWYNAFSWAEYGFNRLRGMSEKEAKASISLKPIDIGSSKYNDMMSGYIKEMEANAKRYENFAVNMPTTLSETTDKGKGKQAGATELTKEQIAAAKKAAKEAEKARKKEHDHRQDILDGINRKTKADQEAQEELDAKESARNHKAISNINKETALKQEVAKSTADINAEATLTYQEQQLRQIEEEKQARISAGVDVADAEAEAQAKIARLQRQNSIELIAGMDVAKNAVMGLENALVDAFMTGKLNAQDMFRAIAADLARLAIRQAVTAPLMGGISSLFASADGNAFSGSGKVQAFADGGAFTNSVVSKPTTAPMALFGEAGPEAIMPLQRTSDGKLGVVATGTPTQNIKIEMINQSGQELQTTQSEQKFNGEQWVIGVVIDAARRNRSGMRDVLRGGQ